MSLKTQLQANNTELQNHLADIMNLPDIEDFKKGEYVWKKLTAKDGDFVSYVPDNDPNKYPNGGIGYDGFYYELYGDSTLKIVTWADGTDEEIVEMVRAADAGEINLADYWTVGQERKVTLNAMSAANGLESHTKQEVTLVLMHAGGMTLENPVESGRNTCSFVVGLKNSLKETGIITTIGTNTGGWKECVRRTWCNNIFKNSIPLTLLPIFKAFKNKSTKGNYSTTLNEVVDYFCLPSEYEVSASTTYAGAKEGFQFEWYKTYGNRVKKKGDSGTDGFEWFLRSCYKSSNAAWCYVASDNGGIYNTTSSTWELGISPFGCI